MDRFLPFTFTVKRNNRVGDEDAFSAEHLLSKMQANTSKERTKLGSWLPFLAHLLLIAIYTIVFAAERQQWQLRKTHGLGIIDSKYFS